MDRLRPIDVALLPVWGWAPPSAEATEPPCEFARRAARLAPDVHVRILEPGAALQLRDVLA